LALWLASKINLFLPTNNSIIIAMHENEGPLALDLVHSSKSMQWMKDNLK